MENVQNLGLVLQAVAAAVVALIIWHILHRRRNSSSVRNIPGPPSPSWLFGNMVQLRLPNEYGDCEFQWQKLYGTVYRIKGCCGEDRLMVSDPVAMNFILNAKKFEQTPAYARSRRILFDKTCLFNVTGQEHARLRAVFNPSFSAAGIRAFHPMMAKAAEELTNVMDSHAAGSKTVNMWPVLANATLSAITRAVLGCESADLGEEFVGLVTRVVALVIQVNKTSILIEFFGNQFPEWIWDIIALVPTQTLKELRKGKELAKRIGVRLVREKVAAAKLGLEMDGDVFSQLAKPNHSGKVRLTEEEVAAHTSLLVLAGYETSSNALAFGLLELARNPAFQDALRREIHGACGGMALTDVGFNDMPLLNAFIKEILRLHPGLGLEDLMATEDTVLPLRKSIITLSGECISQIPIQKGQIVGLAIASSQRAESLWGPDADKFNPYRWIQGNNYQGEAIGPYANLSSFLGGPRTCLGWRFALVEMQMFLCELVGKYSFSFPGEGDSTRAAGAHMVAPVTSDGQRGAPLRVTRIV
ncbi:cytochrome P450 [Roridomyces roridus]|uniref:Cytochrome P450 n=1 Tax=Roridomyces roridus TaxID=1738132 RepID=A0AAD7C0A7_9AGAR|nr:cytochrome P450 [Roridomyces roridus]